MSHDVRVSLTRLGIILGALVALVALTTAFKSILDERYVQRAEFQRDLMDMRADIRVLRCQLVKDCGSQPK